MAWDDVNNLWWLKRQDTSESMLPAIGVGVQIRQQQQEMALRLKQQALQQQLRLDALEIKNRQVDQEMEEYENQKQDMLDLQDAISGKNPNPSFRTKVGWERWDDHNRTKSLIEWRKAREVQEAKNAVSYEEQLVDLLKTKSFRPQAEAISFGQKRFGWTPELAAELEQLHDEGIKIGEIKLPIETIEGVKGYWKKGVWNPLQFGLQRRILNRSEEAAIKAKELQIKTIQEQRSQLMSQPNTPDWENEEAQIKRLTDEIAVIESGTPTVPATNVITTPSGRKFTIKSK